MIQRTDFSVLSKTTQGATQHTPEPWIWEHVPSAGLQIKAKLPFHPYTGSARQDKPIRLEPDRLYTFFRLPRPRDITFQVDVDGVLVATLAYEDWVQFKCDDWNAMQTANARLIASAPDLLDACKALLDSMVSLGLDCEGYYDEMKQAHTVITKAV